MFFFFIGLPLAIMSFKIFLWGFEKTWRRFPSRAGSRAWKDVSNYLLATLIGGLLLGPFMVFTLMYLVYSVAYLVTLFDSLELTLWTVLIFSALYIAYFCQRQRVNGLIYKLFKPQLVGLQKLNSRPIAEADIKKIFNRVYLVLFDSVVFLIYGIVIAESLSGLIART